MKNKDYQFLNFPSNQMDFGSEKRNRECEMKKGKKKKKKKPNSGPIPRVLLYLELPLNFIAFDNHI